MASGRRARSSANARYRVWAAARSAELTGSSSSRTSGSTASARATATRWTLPSDSSWRRRSSSGARANRSATFSIVFVRLIPLARNPYSRFSRTVPRNNTGRCSTSVTRRRRAGLALATAPSSRTSPSDGRSSSASSRSSVLFPEPLGPTIATAAPDATAKRSRSSTMRPSYRCRTPTSSSIGAALENLQRDVHQQGENQEDEPECEGESEVALTRVQGDRRRQRAGLSADVAAHGHRGSDLRHDVPESGRHHGGEREAHGDAERAGHEGGGEPDLEREESDAVHLCVARQEQSDGAPQAFR